MHIFDMDDQPFLTWMYQHLQGFVINIKRRSGLRYSVYHRAGCSHISTYGTGHPVGDFTQRQYVKVCSDSLQELEDWRVREHKNAQNIYCQTCAPEALAV